MYDCGGADLLNQSTQPVPVTNVEFVVLKTSNRFREAILVPAGITLGTEKYRPLVVVHAVNRPTFRREVLTYFRADQAG